LYFTKNQKEVFVKQFDQKNTSILHTVKIGLEIGLQNENLEAIKTIFDWVKVQPDFEWIGIKDSSGMFFAQFPESKIKEADLLKLNNINMPFISYAQDWKTSLDSGTIYIKFNTKNFSKKKAIFLNDIIYSSTLLIMIVVFVSLFISILFSGPIIKLQHAMNKVAAGDFTYSTAVEGNKEITSLTNSFIFMLEEIKTERKKSESLLLNILPSEIANRLKKGEINISNEYSNVSILFADLVGFTPLSEKLNAHQLVELLNEIFTEFDLLCENYNIEKIKTIGDSYMAASNIPTPNVNSALNIIKVAQGMLKVLAKIEEKYHYQLQIRIGISTGSVVAGIIGKSKYNYDLWGDSVNFASNLESYGTSGKILISESTFLQVNNKFDFKEKEVIKIKGMSDQSVYFLD
jgi:class 3 adenylate cyclase